MSGIELGATAIKVCLERAGLSGQSAGDVELGNVVQVSKMNLARQTVIVGGTPLEAPAPTPQSG